MNSKGFDYTALTIVIIGAINWGLIGFFNFNLVSFLIGGLHSDSVGYGLDQPYHLRDSRTLRHLPCKCLRTYYRYGASVRLTVL